MRSLILAASAGVAALALASSASADSTPTYIHAGYLNWLCDNYLIGGNGPGDRLHQFPEDIVEVG